MKRLDLLRKLADAPLTGTRLCLYCDTFYRNFWLGHHLKRPGLFDAARGSSHAFKFAHVLGELIADAVERKQEGGMRASTGARARPSASKTRAQGRRAVHLFYQNTSPVGVLNPFYKRKIIQVDSIVTWADCIRPRVCLSTLEYSIHVIGISEQNIFKL